MSQKNLFQLVPLVLLFLSFCPLLARPQGNPPTVRPSDWGDWKDAPNFPGIKIRVLCSTYLESTGKAEWNFQFQNSYTKKVYLVYQEESPDSKGAPPKFGSPGGRNLDPGAKSDVYTVYLAGTCDDRKRIYIRIVSISDEQGNQTQARAGAPRSGAFQATGQPGPLSGNRAAGSRDGVSGGPGTQTAARPSATPEQTAASAPAVSVTFNPSRGLLDGAWACHIVNTETVDNQFGHRVQPYEHDSTVTFSANGTAEMTGFEGFSSVRWGQTGQDVTILLGESLNYDLEGTLGPDSITGRVVFIRYPNANNDPTDQYEGSFTCQR
jgi:hypothetical protein